MKNMNKFKVFAASCMVAATVATTSVSAITSDYIVGDVDRDGKVTSQDYEKILDYVKKINTDLDEEQLYLADINGDGNVTLVDYGQLLAAIKGTKPRFYLGDVNRDGKLTEEDAQIILSNFAGKTDFDEEQKVLADINSDGNIDARDAKIVLKYAAGTSYRFLKGDVNRDGKITYADYEVIFNHVNETQLLEGEEFQLANLNDDEKSKY